jgi:hypothetical protein
VSPVGARERQGFICKATGAYDLSLQKHLLSTPEEKCIGFPEQKYISEAGKKGR